MHYGSVYRSGSRTTGSEEANPSGLLHYGKTLLLGVENMVVKLHHVSVIKEEMQHIGGLGIEGGLDHGHYCTGYG